MDRGERYQSMKDREASPEPDPEAAMLGDFHDDMVVDNLDDFFSKLYVYFYEGGFTCILVGRILRIVEATFVICFTSFLVFAVDWSALLSCHQEDCEKVKPLKNSMQLHHLSFWQSLYIVLDIGFVIYLVLLIWEFFIKSKEAWEMRYFYRKYLGLDDRTLQTMQWGDVCAKTVEAAARHNISRVGNVDQLTITMRIMRKDNYLIAMVNKDILSPNNNLTLTKSLEWNVKFLISQMITKGFYNSEGEDFYRNVESLKKELRKLALINLLVSPFVLCYLLIDTIFTYVAQLKENPGKLNMRRWTCMALWKFREFNEVQHVFDRRTQQSNEAATNYVKQFPLALQTIVAKTAIFILGGFAAIIIILSIRNDSLLIFINVFGQNLLWWLGILSLCMLTAMHFVTDPHQVFDPNTAMAKLVQCTHYHPSRWRNNAHLFDVRADLLKLFQLRWWTFLQELASILITPFQLSYRLTARAEDIVQFMKDYTVDVPGTGYVCALSTFDFEKFGNLPKSNAGATVHTALNAPVKASDRLMEKAFMSFQATHPTWVAPEEAQSIVDWMERKKQSSSAASSTATTPPQTYQPHMFTSTLSTMSTSSTSV